MEKTQVLFENKSKNKDEYFGRDEYSNSVNIKSNKCLKGKIQEIKIMMETKIPYLVNMIKKLKMRILQLK